MKTAGHPRRDIDVDENSVILRIGDGRAIGFAYDQQGRIVASTGTIGKDNMFNPNNRRVSIPDGLVASVAKYLPRPKQTKQGIPGGSNAERLAQVTPPHSSPEQDIMEKVRAQENKRLGFGG